MLEVSKPSRVEITLALVQYPCVEGEALSMHEFDPAESPKWSPEAEAKLKNIPFFVRTQARQRIEHLAREQGLEAITADLVELARLEFGQ